MSHPTPFATQRSATGIPTGKLAVWWIIASEIVIFGGLLGSYLMYRLYHMEEFSQAASNTSTFIGTINTCLLLTSSLFAVLAHNAVENNDSKKAFNYLWCTFAGGLGFLLVKSFEWNMEIDHGFVLGKNESTRFFLQKIISTNLSYIFFFCRTSGFFFIVLQEQNCS